MEDKVKRNIAKNILFHRKRLNLTQAELADKLNYSDKSISKWERGDGVPDIYVLNTLAEFFGVTVDELISDENPSSKFVKPSHAEQKRRVMVSSMYAAIVWIVATLVYFGTRVAQVKWNDWLSFVYAVPASLLVYSIFYTVWKQKKMVFIFSSAILWSLAAALFLSLDFPNKFLLFIVAVPVQILLILLFLNLINMHFFKDKFMKTFAVKNSSRKEITSDSKQSKTDL